MMDTLHQPRAFGVEEEYLLLDAVSGAPKDCAAEVILAMPQLDQRGEREYFSSQLETSTPVCRDASEAEAVLTRFREVAAEAASGCGAVLAGTGLPPVGSETIGTVTPKARYRRIELEMRGVAQRQYATGTHVHVEVPTSDAGVEALVRVGRWAPVLMALTVNSPFWCGEQTGFASWRHITTRTWPQAGYPPEFADGEEYQHAVQAYVRSGVILDPAMVYWIARLSNRYPTVEFRLADAQLRPSHSVAFAVIVRALVDQAVHDAEDGRPRPLYAPDLINGAIWMAARNGLGSELIDPVTEQTVPAFELVEQMLSTIDGELGRFGDRDRVKAYVQDLRRDGDASTRQLEAFYDEGMAGLLALYREASSVP